MGFVIARDSRGSLVHVRKEDGECVGCIEVGLFEIVRAVIEEEVASAEEDACGAGRHRRDLTGVGDHDQPRV